MNNNNQTGPAVHYACLRPELLTRHNVYGLFAHTVNYDITELPPDDAAAQAGYAYSYKSVTLEPGVLTYPAIVSAIVRNEYPDDAMQAIVNNYLSTPDDPDHTAEFTAMQTLRTKAKQVAREVILETANYN